MIFSSITRPNYKCWLQKRNEQRQKQNQEQPVAMAIKKEPNDGPTEEVVTEVPELDDGIPEAPPPPRISD